MMIVIITAVSAAKEATMKIIRGRKRSSCPCHYHHGRRHLLSFSIGDAEDAAMIVLITTVSDAKGATMIVIILVIILVII